MRDLEKTIWSSELYFSREIRGLNVEMRDLEKCHLLVKYVIYKKDNWEMRYIGKYRLGMRHLGNALFLELMSKVAVNYESVFWEVLERNTYNLRNAWFEKIIYKRVLWKIVIWKCVG